MNEKRITIRLNMDKYTHKKAYEIYKSIPLSQRSDYIRMAIILIRDRDEQFKYIKDMLSSSDIPMKAQISNDEVMDISDDMLEFIGNLSTQK